MQSFAALLALKREKALLKWVAAVFVVWLACTGPLRWYASYALPSWLLGNAPNFFAGITLTLWQAFVIPSRPLASAGVAFAVLCTVEASQLFMPQHRADIFDLVASLTGCLVASGCLSWRSRVLRSGP
jgi:glycopeptide antibiotics resistance protein